MSIVTFKRHFLATPLSVHVCAAIFLHRSYVHFLETNTDLQKSFCFSTQHIVEGFMIEFCSGFEL